MADINWDANLLYPSSMTMGLTFNTLRLPPNPLTGSMRTVGMPGARWVATLSWDLLNRDKADPIRALLLKLRGQANRLVIWDLVQPLFRGVGGGSPTVNGGSQVGVSLNITGATPNITNWALPGDKFAVNGELKICVASANTNGSGQTTLTFEPALRASPSNGAAITIIQPTAKFVLESNSVLWEYLTGPAVRNIKIGLIEAFI